jgi:hypothetical protein
MIEAPQERNHVGDQNGLPDHQGRGRREHEAAELDEIVG